MKVVFILLLIHLSNFSFGQGRSAKFIRLTTSDGLSQGHVSAIIKDRKGFMWFATDGGLNKYDGYRFTVYKNDRHNPASISNDIISDIKEDYAGNLWIATRGGLDRYDRQKDEFIHYHPGKNGVVNTVFQDSRLRVWAGTDDGLYEMNAVNGKFKCYSHNRYDNNSLSNDFVYDLAEDKNGDLWVATKSELNRFNPSTGRFIHYKNNPADASSIGADWIMSVYTDKRDNIWAGTIGGGIARFDYQKNAFINYLHDAGNKNSISLNDIHSFCEGNDGNLWVGTDNGGISIYDYKANSFIKNYKNDPYNINSLANNSISSLYKDEQETVWIGTFSEGVNFLPKNDEKFKHYTQVLTNKTSLNDHNILAIIKDTFGLWLGTDGGGLNRFNKKTQTFDHFVYDPNNRNSINSNYVVSVLEADKNLIALGLYQGGFDLFNTLTKTFSHHVPEKHNANSVSSSSISILCKGENDKIWLGTWGEGLNLYDRKKNTFTHYLNNPKNANSIVSNSINSLLKDKEGNLWIGTDDGLDKYNEATNTFTHYRHSDSDKKSLSQNFVNYVFEDRAGRLWIATAGGLNAFDEKAKAFTVFTEKDGLANNTIQGILEDQSGNLWLSSNNGLTKFNPVTKAVRNYNSSDGIQGKEFKPGSCYKAEDGEMYFGGTNGFNAFNPNSLRDNTFTPPVYFTGFEIFNRQVVPGGSNAPLKEQISEAKVITLSYKQSVFSFEFAALNYILPEKNQYAYKLEGFDKDWTYAGNKRTATYTNLDPGKYVFHVKGSNNDGLWNKAGASVTIIILPPYWLTWWFRLGVVFSIIGGAAAFYLFRINAVKAQKRILEQKVQKQTAQLQESTAQLLISNEEERKSRLEADQANRSKSVFLATMSHEIRTPMNGVIGMCSLLMETELSDEQKSYAKTISTCGESLLSVINGILDFSKIESGKMELENKAFHLQTCLEESLDIFSFKAAESGVKLGYYVDAGVPAHITGDNLRLRQVLINLVGNAMKFTPKGEIFVSVHLVKAAAHAPMLISFKVRDTGIGIPADKIERLFKAFSQVDSSATRRHGGTGLGLVICEKLVTLMGGQINVESEFGKGSTFTFTIETTGQNLPDNGSRKTGESLFNPGNKEKQKDQKLKTDFANKHPMSILVAEDNAVNALIICNIFKKLGYQPDIAKHGREALNMLEMANYDVIFMDVQMPEMDGLEATRSIRLNSSQQPVIIAMTANAMQGDREECIDAGMDDYLSKPINLDAMIGMLKKWSAMIMDGNTAQTQKHS